MLTVSHWALPCYLTDVPCSFHPTHTSSLPSSHQIRHAVASELPSLLFPKLGTLFLGYQLAGFFGFSPKCCLRHQVVPAILLKLQLTPPTHCQSHFSACQNLQWDLSPSQMLFMLFILSVVCFLATGLKAPGRPESVSLFFPVISPALKIKSGPGAVA